MKQLALSILGTDRPGIGCELIKLVTSCGCNIINSQINTLGSSFIANLLLDGTWNALAKFEASLAGFAAKFEVQAIMARTETPKPLTECMPYSIYVIAMDKPGIIYQIINFFAEQLINVNSLVANSYLAPFTNACMLSLSMSISISCDIHIADLRERFTLLCDDLNLDAIMEPEKN